MQTIHALFDDYASHHRTRGNKTFHRLGIPMIMFSLLGLLARVTILPMEPMPVDLAIVTIVAVQIYYLMLEWRLAIAMLVAVAAMYAGGRMVPVVALWVIFVAGWIFQFIGHSVYEKRQPAFFRNLVHLLIGPLWILNDVFPVVRREAPVE